MAKRKAKTKGSIPDATPEARHLIPLRQFCRAVGFGYDWGRKAAARREFDTVRYGRRVLVPVVEINKFIESRLVPAK